MGGPRTHSFGVQAAKTTVFDCVSTVIKAAATTYHFALLSFAWGLTLLINHSVMYMSLIPR